MRCIVLLLLALTPAWNLLISQRSIPLKAGIIAEQISLPTFEDYGSRKGYGITLGTNFTYKTKEKSAFLQTLDVHYFQHKDYGSAFMVSSLFDYSIRPGKLNIDVKAGPGFMLFSPYTPVYSPADGGGYEKASQVQGKWAGIVSLSCSYQIGSVRPYLAYTAFAEIPFFFFYSALLPHQMLEVGVSFSITKNK